MVKLVHLADLHAGKLTAKTLDRNEDLLHALEQVYDFVKEERPDYLVVAGDIFDKRRPDSESSKLVGDFFVRVAALGTKVLAAAGNHDGSGFLDMFTPWSRRWGVRIFPRLNTKELVYADGEVAFAVVPFVSERAITELSEGGADARVRYAEKMRKLLTYAAERVKGFKYRFLVAHLFFARSKVGKTEQEITVSDAYAVDQSALSEVFHYAALGHVHRHQRLEFAPAPAYYSGSLYQLDFGEEGQDKFFNFVVVENGRTSVRPIKLSLLRELRKVVLKRGEDAKKVLEREKRPNLYLWVEVEASSPQEFTLRRSLAERILGENLLKVTVRWKDTSSRSLFRRRNDGRSVEDLRDPLKMYREYCLTALGRKPDPRTEELIRELLQRVGV
ncbi:MAG: exonuclease SbcCD subunit D [Aquificae bacterium]|nr:exonuclease SbcCD subunit D [Aquificota bacterium]